MPDQLTTARDQIAEMCGFHNTPTLVGAATPRQSQMIVPSPPASTSCRGCGRMNRITQRCLT